MYNDNKFVKMLVNNITSYLYNLIYTTIVVIIVE